MKKLFTLLVYPLVISVTMFVSCKDSEDPTAQGANVIYAPTDNAAIIKSFATFLTQSKQAKLVLVDSANANERPAPVLNEQNSFAPDLYITGEAVPSGWVNSPPSSQKLKYTNEHKYEITLFLEPGKLYKFLTAPGSWQPQYGSQSAGVSEGFSSLSVNDGSGYDPAAIPTPEESGTYKIEVDLQTNSFRLTRL